MNGLVEGLQTRTECNQGERGKNSGLNERIYICNKGLKLDKLIELLLQHDRQGQ